MFYTFIQNNSGGSFETNTLKGIGEYVIVEADSAEEANSRAIGIGLYFNGCEKGFDCSCCGDRWYEVDEEDGGKEPSVLGRTELQGDDAYVHYKDGWFKHTYK